MAELASIAVESGRSIGRYFTVISLVPSLLFVLYIYGLLAAGALSGSFQPIRAVHAAERLSVIEIVALFLAALLLGLILHPFQFSMTQFLEGYWGDKGVGRKAARRRILHYRSVVLGLDDDVANADGAWRRAAHDAPPATGPDCSRATCKYPITATRCGWIPGAATGGSKTTGVLRPLARSVTDIH